MPNYIGSYAVHYFGHVKDLKIIWIDWSIGFSIKQMAPRVAVKGLHRQTKLDLI
jgi:hypothetical protein